MRHHHLLRLLLAAAAATLIAGCGSSGSQSSSSGGSSSGGSSSSSSTPSSSSSSGGSASGGAVVVKMQNIAFSPKQLTAKVGQTIKWTNDDSVDHNVTATAGASFHSSNLGQGGTYETKLTKPGTISYVCTIHPGMTGTITVTK